MESRSRDKLDELREIMIYKLKLFLLVATLVGGALITFQGWQADAQTQVVTAGQKFKNIKVLNDLPADQLGPAMNVIAASLGMQCSGCHVSNDKDFDKDGNEHKDIARKMIRMVLSINKENFEGRPEVSCNTCHAGHERPNSTPALYPPPAPVRPAQPAVKPTTDQILAKYAASFGPADQKIGAMSIKATRVENDGKTTEPEDIFTKGTKSVITTHYTGAVITEAFDGTTAWKRSNNETVPLRPFEIEQIKRDATIFGNRDLKTVYARFAYRFMDRIDGRDVYLVFATTADDQRERLFFDAATGALVRRIASMQTIVGQFQYQVDYADFKDFGGIKLPSTIKVAMPAVSWTRKIVSVKDIAVDDSKFAPPQGGRS